MTIITCLKIIHTYIYNLISLLSIIPSMRFPLRALLWGLTLKMGFEILSAAWVTRTRLIQDFNAYQTMYNLCESRNLFLYHVLQPFCTLAAKFLNLGYWFCFVQETIHETKWCLGVHCQSLFELSSFSKFLIAIILPISAYLFNIIVHWIRLFAQIPANLTTSRKAKKAKDFIRHESARLIDVDDE